MKEKLFSALLRRTSSLLVVLVLTFLYVTPVGQSAQHSGPEPLPPAEVVRLLRAGNSRYLAHDAEHPPDYKRERAELVDGQHPFTIFLSCSDSRVPPEIVFDQTLGKLFVIRVAGNVTDSSGLGSVEYAVEHGYSRVLFVMAHESCGAVKTTMDAVRTNSYPRSRNLMALVNSIKPALDTQRLDTNNKADVALNVDHNLKVQMANVYRQSETLATRVATGDVLVIGGVYSLQTGDATPIYYVDRKGGIQPLPH